MKIQLVSTAANKLMAFAGKGLAKVQKYSPEILLVGSIATGIGAIAMTVTATLKLEEVLDEREKVLKKFDEMNELKTSGEMTEEDYSVEDEARERKILFVKTSFKIVKLYAPAIALEALSIGCAIASRNIQHRRYLGAVAAYNGMVEVFDAYRSRVREQLGEDADRRFRYGVETITEEYETTDKKGKTVTKTREVESLTVTPSGYSRVFDNKNPNWDQNRMFCRMFLTNQQNFWNDTLRTRPNGIVLLNEVYDSLGFEPTQEGAIAGWCRDSHTGDGFIDFGLMNFDREDVRGFVNGNSDYILLDFNIDGLVWDKLA